MSKIMLRRFPGIAKIAVKAADTQVQNKRLALGIHSAMKKLARAGSKTIDPAAVKKYKEVSGGGKALREALTNRQRAGKAYAASQAVKGSDLNRKINARGKGVTFRRVGGRIVPIRGK